MTKLHRFCTYTPLKVLGISFAIAFISAFILDKIMEKNARETMYLMIYPLLIIPNILFSIGSYSIYLNLYKEIRDNILLSLLSFYFPVFIAGFIMLTNGIFGVLAIPLIAVPFLIPQTYYFMQFRKRLATGEIMDDFYYTSYDDEQNN